YQRVLELAIANHPDQQAERLARALAELEAAVPADLAALRPAPPVQVGETAVATTAEMPMVATGTEPDTDTESDTAGSDTAAGPSSVLDEAPAAIAAMLASLPQAAQAFHELTAGIELSTQALAGLAQK